MASKLAGSANGDDFGVGAGVVMRDLVDAFGDDFATPDDDRAEGSAVSGADVFDGQVNGMNAHFDYSSERLV